MIKNLLIIFFSIFIIISSLPESDLVSSPPGMIGAIIYSGYLKTLVPGRQIHYVYVHADVDQPMSAPLTVWFNGGPGCSSLIGLIQQIGPYIVANSYKLGDQLRKNQYSWNKISNLLFLQSPAAVGFSSDNNATYHWTDQQTANDAFQAIKDFIFNKAPQFQNSSLYLTGESYAGKYVPDVANLMVRSNKISTNKMINIKGIMVGNGVMSFENNELRKSQIQYMVDRQQFSTRLQSIYEYTCSRNFDSPRCKFFQYEFDVFLAYLDQYDIYKVCQNKPAEAISLLKSLAQQKYNIQHINLRKNITMLGEIPDCPKDDGAISYWNLNKIPFKTTKYNKSWSPCYRINYQISQRGSIKEYNYISPNEVKVWLFSGDWDDVVPYTDTQKNMKKLNNRKIGQWNPWNVVDQHAGHYQVYSNGLTVITVTKAGHMVPQTQPKAAYQLFYNFINNKGVNNQIF